MTRVLIADDHAMFRKGLRLLLEEEEDMEVIAEAGDGQKAIASALDLAPDVIVMDITMPELDGIEACRKILSSAPRTRVMALSIHDGERFVGEMLSAGATGYVLKESAPEDLVEGIRTVMRGEVYLSPAIAGVVVSHFRKGLVRVDEEENGAQKSNPIDDVILQTKLFRPPISPALITRERALQMLAQSMQHPLVLLAAPAGYGKSTLMAQWLESSAFKSAWYSIDENDNDSTVFLQYLMAAVQSIFPASFKELSSQLAGYEEVPLALIITALSNDLSRIEEPFVLVLDDYHRLTIESSVHTIISALLEHPPSTLHLIISTRRNPPLPLSSLRARGLLHEMRLTDLEFSRAETAALLEQAAGQTLSQDAIDHVQQSTEGWVVGLRMAMLAMRYHEDRNSFLQSFGGDIRQVQDYLITEVMQHEDPAIRDNLCKISILNRFCAPLCAAVCAGEKRPAEAVLDEEIFSAILDRSGLLCIALDGHRQWFRFHHLFQELLRQQLGDRFSAAEIVRLHARAAEWLESNGYLEEAMQHLVKAGDQPAMCALILRNRETLYQKEQWLRLDSLLSLFTADSIDNDPELLMIKAWVGIIRQLHTEIWELVARTEELLEDQSCSGKLVPVFGQLDIFLSWRSYAAADGASALAHAQSAVERLPASFDMERGYAQVMVCVSLQMTGREAEGIQYVSEALEKGRHAHPSYRARLLEALGFVYWMGGDLTRLCEVGAAMIRLGESESLAVTSYNGHYRMGKALYALGELEHARKILSAVIKPGYRATDRFLIGAAYFLSLTYEALGQPELASGLLDNMAAHLIDDSNSFSLAMVNAFRAELAVRQGRLADAEHWLASFDPSPMPRGDVSSNDELTAAKILFHQRTSVSLKKVEKYLAELRIYFEKINNTRFLIETLALQSLVLQAMEKTTRAKACLEQAIEMALPCGFIRLFVDLGPEMSLLLNQLTLNEEALRYVGRIQAAFRGPTARSDPSDTVDVATVTLAPAVLGLLDPLTKRELEILALLTERRTNQEIADQLYISVKTVRRHTENIYGKLGVHGRHEAVAKATGLGIIK